MVVGVFYMSKAKGKRTVYKAISYLKNQGMIVDEVEMSGRYIQYKDLFAGYCTKCWTKDCDHKDQYRFEGFDLISMSPKSLFLIQVKTNTPPTRKNYIRFATKFASRYIKILSMTWYDRRGWVIHTFNKNGIVTKKDLRKTNEKKDDTK
jgi:hypothetical protein